MTKISNAQFKSLEAEIASVCLERDEYVHGIVLALLARANVFLLGAPGTGKSMLADEVTARLKGASLFAVLMTRFTTPDEILGPVSLKALEQERLERVPTGMLQEAHVAFLDEVFKANSAILNALLTAMNERHVTVGGKRIKIPLFTMIGASNEGPQGEDLAAVYDRFVLRYVVPSLQSEDSLRKLLVAPRSTATPTVAVTLGDVQAAQAEVDALPVSDAAANAALSIRLGLAQQGVRPSDRRLKASVQIARAEAWLAGRAQVDVEDLAVFVHTLWGENGERAKVRTVVYDVALPGLAKAMELYDLAVEQQGVIASSDERTRMEGMRKLRELDKECDGLAKASGASAKVREVAVKIATLKKAAVKAVMGE